MVSSCPAATGSRRAGLQQGPANLQLFVDAQQVPIRVNGEVDGKFDAQDSVEFYGLGLDTPTTNTRVYWLISGGQAGQRVPQVAAPGALNNSGSSLARWSVKTALSTSRRSSTVMPKTSSVQS